LPFRREPIGGSATFKKWLDAHVDDVVPKSALGKAIAYSLLQSAKANQSPLNEWLTFVLEALPRYTTDDERRSLLPHNFDIQRLESA